MPKYLGFQYSISYGTAVTRCETMQMLTLTPDFIAPALWTAKSPVINPVDYKISGKLQERVYTAAGSWRWPAEVARDQEWEHFQHLFINEAVRQWRPRLLACIRVHGRHFEHRLRLVCLHKRTLWQSHDCPLDFNRTAFTDFVPACVMF